MRETKVELLCGVDRRLCLHVATCDDPAEGRPLRVMCRICKNVFIFPGFLRELREKFTTDPTPALQHLDQK